MKTKMAYLIRFNAEKVTHTKIELFKELWDELRVDVEKLPNKYEGFFVDLKKEL